MRLILNNHLSHRTKWITKGAMILLTLGITACGDTSENKTKTDQQTGEVLTEAPTVNTQDMGKTMSEYAIENIAYLKTNAVVDGWAVTASGLQYKVETEGTGDVPTAEDMVKVHYAGRLIDGTEFDSSFKRGEPAIFPAGRLIPGWVEALTSMKEGAKWQLAIPAELAYGETDRGPIPADSTLVFDVELIQIMSEQELQAEQDRMIAEMKAPQEAYLQTNGARSTVTTTASGLQYKIIESGGGATPSDTSTVTVHYAGRLIDGTEFDSSYKRGEPASFPVNGVIPGWTEALQLMQEGDKWELTIPYDIAYGERGSGRSIPPYATLVFDVELVKVN